MPFQHSSLAANAVKKKKLGKLGPIAEKIVLPVETDVNRLVNYVCGSNIYIKGEDIKVYGTSTSHAKRFTHKSQSLLSPQLKPDSEYPDWLWNIHVGAPAKLEDLDPETKQYWRKLRGMALKRNNTLAKLKKF